MKIINFSFTTCYISDNFSFIICVIFQISCDQVFNFGGEVLVALRVLESAINLEEIYRNEIFKNVQVSYICACLYGINNLKIYLNKFNSLPTNAQRAILLKC